MWLKPVKIYVFDDAADWTDLTVHPMFSLQRHTPRSWRLFSAGPTRSFNEFEYRILLCCPKSKEIYIVSLSRTMAEAHGDWQWIERTLFSLLAEESIRVLDLNEEYLLLKFKEKAEGEYCG